MARNTKIDRTFTQTNAIAPTISLYEKPQTPGPQIKNFTGDLGNTTESMVNADKANSVKPVAGGPKVDDMPATWGSKGNLDSYYGGPVLPEQDPTAIYMDEIHKAASEKNYKALLNADIAAYNLKMNTKKYLDNELASRGLNTQGYGTSAHIGVDNAAANLYAQNLENYNQANEDALVAAQEREKEAINEAKANATEADNQLVTFLQYSDGSDESIANYMDKYGYKLKDGVWVNKETGEPASAYVQSAVQSAMENGSSSGTNAYRTDYSEISPATITAGAESVLANWASNYKNVDKNGYESAEALRDAVVGNKDNSSTDKLGNIVGFELGKLQKMIDNGSLKDGTLIKLQRDSGYHEAYLVLYLNGRLYVVSDDDREGDDGQVASRYNQYEGPKETIKGW